MIALLGLNNSLLLWAIQSGISGQLINRVDGLKIPFGIVLLSKSMVVVLGLFQRMQVILEVVIAHVNSADYLN
jgi:hypothetical protein